MLTESVKVTSTHLLSLFIQQAPQPLHSTGIFIFNTYKLDAEDGIAHVDLLVMSQTSCRAALPRDKYALSATIFINN